MTGIFDDSTDPPGPRLITALAKLGMALKAHAWLESGQSGINPTQAQILSYLSQRGPDQRLGDIAQALGITPATASDSVQALVRKGLVRKERSSADARALEVRLTEAGELEAGRVAGWPEFLLGAVDTLTVEEQGTLLRAFTKVIRQLQEQHDIPVSAMCATCLYFRPNVHADPMHPHHCAFADAPFGERHLRLECADHSPAPAEQAHQAWETFVTKPDR